MYGAKLVKKLGKYKEIGKKSVSLHRNNSLTVNFTDMKTILIAEDNDSNYLLMTYILKKSYEFVRAINGLEAVEMAKKGGIDLILMDMKMPVMDGVEATVKIRENHPDLPIIALTANAFESDQETMLQAGCNDFLAKPVNSVKCLAAIEQLIGK